MDRGDQRGRFHAIAGDSSNYRSEVDGARLTDRRNDGGRTQPLPVVGAAGRDPRSEQRPGHRAIPQRRRSWSGRTSTSVTDLKPNRNRQPQGHITLLAASQPGLRDNDRGSGAWQGGNAL